MRRLAFSLGLGFLAALGAQGAGTVAAASPAPPAVTLHTHTPIPVVPALPGPVESPIRDLTQSDNWSGYDLTSGGYTAIAGCWTVPSVSPSAWPTYSSTWIGIDGGLGDGTDQNLFQTGTEQDWSSTSGLAPYSAEYSAWWEVLPANAITIRMTITPGDVMCASITKDSPTEWTISLTDQTTGAFFSLRPSTKTFPGTGETAEWIVEAPYASTQYYTCGPCTLANFGHVTFDSASVNTGVNPALNPVEGWEMVQDDSFVAIPSAPNGSGNGFTVSYAPPPSPGWAGYEGLGSGPLGGQPHVISSGPGNLDVFWRGTDNGLWHTWYSGGQWHGPQELAPAGSLASDPSPVSSEAGVLDVFWKGTDGNLWHVWYQNGWHGPQSLGGGPLGSAPQPVSWGSGQIDVFWKGTNGDLWHAYYGSGSWHSAQDLGMGPLGSPPDAVTWGPGELDVFWAGTGSPTLWHASYSGGWHGPIQMPGASTVAGTPYPVSWGVGNEEVFWKGTDGSLWQDYYVNGWVGSASLGFGGLGSDPQPMTFGTGLLDVFWRTTGGGVSQAYYANGWHGSYSLGASDVSSLPDVVEPSAGDIDAFWEDTSANLDHAFYAGGWYGPFLVGDGPMGSAPSVASWGNGHMDIFWKGTDGNLWTASFSS